ncbi:MAG: hypothetical protein K0S32_1421 [Bacteroidetes bacterium]|jgi:hypothetical protein|nr:hypothetical protein [Bacteroidota bacterium]
MKKLFLSLICLAVLVTANSCKKKPDEPSVKKLSDGTIYTVSQLRSIASCTNNCTKRFTAGSKAYLIGIVLADEVSGNFYKEVYVRDRTGQGAIRLDFISSKSGFFIGDSVRMMLDGYDVNLNSGMLEIDSIDYEKAMVKFGSGANPQPIQLDLTQITPSNPYTNYLCDLVTINNVSFLPADTAKMWSDAVGQMSLNRIIQNCTGNQVTVRTSNYASFASLKTPKGFGSIMGIATAYGSTNQLVIRRTSEVNMNGTGCVVYHKKDWNDNSLTSGGWTQASVTNPSVMWTASTFGTDEFAKISGYISGNTNSENWLISPALNLSSAVSPILNFRTAAKFTGNTLEVYVSTNYSSGAPSSATWTQLTGFALSPNNPGTYAWTPSGNVSLNAFKTSNVRIAFKYSSTTSASTTYEVDDVIVMEN